MNGSRKQKMAFLCIMMLKAEYKNNDFINQFWKFIYVDLRSARAPGYIRSGVT